MGTDPAPSPAHPLPQNERYKITFSQEHATTKSGCSQSKILSVRVYLRDGKRTFWGVPSLPFPFAAGAAKKMQRKQASPMKRRQKTRPLSHWRAVSGFYFPLSYEVLFTFLKEPTSLSLSRGPTVIKRPTETPLPPSLPLAVAAPVPELSAADATSAAKTDLHSLVFSLSNRATRRRRIIATAKGGTGTVGRRTRGRMRPQRPF